MSGYEYTYHIINSLMPPSTAIRKHMNEPEICLENICASFILRNLTCEMLSNTPKHLYKNLWMAYLQDKYYSYVDLINVYYSNLICDEPDVECDNLRELLYHWPDKEFILKDVMLDFPLRPKLFPQRLNDFSTFEDEAGCSSFYQKNKEYLEKFYRKVTLDIVEAFAKFNRRDHKIKHRNFNLRKLNISGFHLFSWVPLSLKDPIDPYTKNNTDELEVILDVIINLSDYDGFDLCKPSKYSGQSPYILKLANRGVVFKFSNVAIHIHKWNLSGVEQEANRLTGRLLDEGASSIGLSMRIPQLRFNNISLSHFTTTLVFLQDFKNLIHLDLSNINMHGQLDNLKQMARGFIFLRLSTCRLENKDLDQLIGSPHQSTLQDLDLSNNKFFIDESIHYLYTLFRNLPNVKILKLKNILNSLHPFWSDYNLSIVIQLFESFQAMENITHLDLIGSEFESDIVKAFIMKLKESMTLKYLRLSLPYLLGIEVKDFCREINTNMNSNRSQLLYVEFINTE